jgi:hypothetical protein
MSNIFRICSAVSFVLLLVKMNGHMPGRASCPARHIINFSSKVLFESEKLVQRSEVYRFPECDDIISDGQLLLKKDRNVEKDE